MTSLKTRSTFPAWPAAVAAVAGVFFLVTAVAHVVVVPPPATSHPAGFGVLQAEVHACMARSGRGHDECLDEIEGKALIQRAEWLAQNNAWPDDEAGDPADDDMIAAAAAAHPPRSRAP